MFLLQLRWLIDPRSPRRKEFIKSLNYIDLRLKKDDEEFEDDEDDEKVDIEPFSKKPNGSIICNLCPKPKEYKQMGYIQSHLKKIHGIVLENMYTCEKCGRSLEDQKTLTRHLASKTDCAKKGQKK